MISVEAFRGRARDWLDQRAPRPPTASRGAEQRHDSVAIFRNQTDAEERATVDRRRRWLRERAEAGFGAIAWEAEHGGEGLTDAHARAYDEEEDGRPVPPGHESILISVDLVGNTLRACGGPELCRRYLPPLSRADEMWCQLFSEPDAGSDLASLQTRAVRDGDQWLVTGQKVWTSGAHFADLGYLLARTDPDASRHRGVTALVVDMHAPGVTVRPLRQMTGGSSFNEVFLDGVRVPVDHTIGEPGDGWRVAMTTLAIERATAAQNRFSEAADLAHRLLRTADEVHRRDDPLVRQAVAQTWTLEVISSVLDRRAATMGSLSKLATTRLFEAAAEASEVILGPAVIADDGGRGRYSWSELRLGIPGFRAGGGTDEIQKNILGERVLGLPR